MPDVIVGMAVDSDSCIHCIRRCLIDGVFAEVAIFPDVVFMVWVIVLAIYAAIVNLQAVVEVLDERSAFRSSRESLGEFSIDAPVPIVVDIVFVEVEIFL